MDVCVVLVVRTVAWNVKWHERRKDLKQYKNGSKRKNHGQAKKKSHREHGCLSLVRPLRRADLSSRGVLPTVVCLSVWSKGIPTSTLKRENRSR
jgi:hypothetical protein